MNQQPSSLSSSGPDWTAHRNLATAVRSVGRTTMQPVHRLRSMLSLSNRDFQSERYRTLLYRFLADNVPIICACIWTWVRLAAAPGLFRVTEAPNEGLRRRAEDRLARLSQHLSAGATGSPVGVVTFLTELFTCLFRDGVFAGFLAVTKDAGAVDRFIPVDTASLRWQTDQGPPHLVLDLDQGPLKLNRSDFYCIPLNGTSAEPLGRSILRAVPFVCFIEQQLVDDMRRTSHNSGYHRLHVKISPPERITGESDTAYIERINGYFDATVSMIRSCGVDENPVTWDNVAIEHVGPDSARGVTNNWFFNHRAMIEDICAGTNLSPFLLGYSYGATTTWSAFKFDVVMRQVRSVQAEVAHFLEWIGNIELALAGIDVRCRFEFDNTFAYQAAEKASIETSRIDDILKLYNAGLIDEKIARAKAAELL